MRNVFLMSIGWLTVALAVIGIFLPLLPTVPFLLVAAWCFTQSSPRCRAWLFNHRTLGPLVQQWSGKQAIPRTIKYRAIASIWVGMGISMLLVHKLPLIIMLAVIGSAVSFYIWQKTET